MSFRKAVEQCPPLRRNLRDGLRGLSTTDRQKVDRGGRRLTGSVNVDAALRSSHPNAARWDYGIGIARPHKPDCVVWLEVHPASSTHIKTVLRKLDWLRTWLGKYALPLQQLPAAYIWVSTGSVAMTRNSPQFRRLAQAGLHFRPRVVRLDEFAE